MLTLRILTTAGMTLHVWAEPGDDELDLLTTGLQELARSGRVMRGLYWLNSPTIGKRMVGKR